MSPWSRHEISLILSAYFHMLRLEIAGRPCNKTAFRTALKSQLNNRSDGSIEFKHQNISAVLLRYGQLYIRGYKPMANYQSLLEEMVLEYLNRETDLEQQFLDFSTDQTVLLPQNVDMAALEVAAPAFSEVAEPHGEVYVPKINKPNYLQIEQANRRTGSLGEELILQYERWRLLQSDKQQLADRVEWVSRDRGDGAGFDIRSFNPNGSDRYIEVKTTRLSEYTPFFFTRNELNFSREHREQYHLYRVFRLAQRPRFFSKKGSFEEICRFQPEVFDGRL